MNKLFIIKSEKEINLLKENGIDNFVYPLFSFCVGVENEFSLSEIKEENSYLFVNRVLDEESANNLNMLLHKLPNNIKGIRMEAVMIKGIIFDDVGIIKMLEDVKIEKILMPSHFACNYESVNIYNEYVDSVILPFDITEDEVEEIISKSSKKVSLYAFGLIGSAYSRRYLIKNYSKHENVKYENPLVIENNNHKFILFENEYGTYFYHLPYFNGLNNLNKDIKYAIYHPICLSENDLKDLVNGKINVETDHGFLHNKTIYKIKGDKK